MSKKYFSLLTFLFVVASNVNAQLPVVSFTQFPNGTTSFTYPVLVTHCGDARRFVVQRDGIVKIVDSLGNVLATPFLDISAINDYANYNEEGLLGLAFDPNYATNGYFYVNYTGIDANPGPTHIVRYTVSADPNVADAASAYELLTFTQPYANHNGGSLAFGPDGYLYDGQGDGGSAGDPGNRAQNKQTYLGKILRIDPHGGTPYGIPASNPFLSDTTYLPEIWDMGVRNPWRFSFDRITGDFWIGDVGQGAWEEVDMEPAGSGGGMNYGWRCYEGNHNYDTAGCGAMNTYDAPVYEYAHTGGYCSITGGYVYRGAQYSDLWGRYLYTDYCKGILWSLLPAGGGTWNNDTLGQFVANTYSSFGEDNFGELYICAHNSNKVYKISSADCTPVAYIEEQTPASVCEGSSLHALYGIGLTYQWQMGGVDVIGATNNNYSPTVNGDYTVIVTKGACSDTSEISNVTIHPIPTVSFSVAGGDTAFCDNGNPVTLSGVPAGGTFSGMGITGSSFNPNGLAVGSYTINYFYTDSNGCSNNSTKTFTVAVCGGTGNINAVSEVNIFPNPSNGSFTLSIHSVKNQEVVLQIFNALGQLQMEKTISVTEGKTLEQIKIANPVTGVYRYTLKGNEVLRNGSFVIQ